MSEIAFLVQGSAVEPYIVKFNKNDNKFTASCSCPAGVKGIYCKHRLGIMQGYDNGIVSFNKHEVVTIKTWLAGTDIEHALKKIVALETALEKTKQDLSLAKKQLSKVLTH